MPGKFEEKYTRLVGKMCSLKKLHTTIILQLIELIAIANNLSETEKCEPFLALSTLSVLYKLITVGTAYVTPS